jgi:hypothetical protein
MGESALVVMALVERCSWRWRNSWRLEWVSSLPVGSDIAVFCDEAVVVFRRQLPLALNQGGLDVAKRVGNRVFRKATQAIPLAVILGANSVSGGPPGSLAGIGGSERCGPEAMAIDGARSENQSHCVHTLLLGRQYTAQQALCQ